MRILIAIGVLRQREAGAAGVVLNHARELERRGHQVECWFLDDVLAQPARPRRFEALLFAVGVARRIRKDPARFDVVNIHAPWACAYGLWRKLSRSAGGPPCVLTMQGSEDRYVRAMRQEARKGRAWNFGLRNRIWHRLYHQTMYDWSIRTADYGVVANREAWICAELKYGREPGRIWYVPNGTEEQFFVERPFGTGEALKLLYVGSWLDRKGVYYLADAFALLANRIPGVRLTVAGCLRSIDQVAVCFAPECRDRITVVPFIARDEMPNLFAEHDIFVFPSLVEGMPLTLLEAMATAMPVVTTNTCGMSDVVEDEVNGLLVTPANSGELARATERLVRSADLRRRLGLSAQQTARSYTWGCVAQRLEKILLLATQGVEALPHTILAEKVQTPWRGA